MAAVFFAVEIFTALRLVSGLKRFKSLGFSRRQKVIAAIAMKNSSLWRVWWGKIAMIRPRSLGRLPS